jgi:hypothetical protein
MTRYTWLRIFVASLIFLGDGLFAAENRLRVDTEAAASDITSQVSKQAILDDYGSSPEAAVTYVSTKPAVVLTINHKLVSLLLDRPNKLKYLPLHPRAPPVITTS